MNDFIGDLKNQRTILSEYVEKMLTSRWVTLDTLVTNDDGLDYY